MRIGDDQQLEFFQRLDHVRHARHGVAAVAEDDHCLQRVALVNVIGIIARRIEPAGRRDARELHVFLAAPRRTTGFGRHFVKAGLQVVIIDLPDTRPMSPRAFHQPVIERQRRDIEAHVGGALHVAMATENIGTAAKDADIAGREQQVAIGAHIGGAHRMLGAAHAPDEGRRTFLRKGLGDLAQLGTRHAGDALGFFRRPFGDFGAHEIHADNAALDEGLVFPAVLEDVPHHAPDHGNVRARADADKFRGVGRRAREARIEHDHIGAVDLLAGQHMLQRHGMGFGRIRPHEDDGLGVADVIVGIGLRAITPGVGDARHRGRMADAGLMVDRVRAPEGAELAEEIGTLVGEFRGAQQIDGIGTALGADLVHLVADLADGLVPAHAGPFAIHELHRIFQAAITMHELAHRGPLGAMRATVDRAVIGGLLPDPDAVLHFRHDAAADRAMGADVFLDLALDARSHRAGLGAAHGTQRQRAQSSDATGSKTRTAQERAAVEDAGSQARGNARETRT